MCGRQRCRFCVGCIERLVFWFCSWTTRGQSVSAPLRYRAVKPQPPERVSLAALSTASVARICPCSVCGGCRGGGGDFVSTPLKPQWENFFFEICRALLSLPIHLKEAISPGIEPAVPRTQRQEPRGMRVRPPWPVRAWQGLARVALVHASRRHLLPQGGVHRELGLGHAVRGGAGD